MAASGRPVARVGHRWHHGPVKTRSSTLTLTGGELKFDVLTDSGHTIPIDSDGVTGPRPTELLGVALAGCTSMDVISILRKKRQAVAGYEVRVTGLQREEHPRAFIRFDVVHVLEGTDLDPAAVRRAIELSARKYCSVGSTLATGSPEIHHAYVIRTADGDELPEDVLVTGPFMSFEELVAGV
jgi:putative redox protein